MSASKVQSKVQSKVHRHLIEALAPALEQIFNSQVSVEAILERTFKANRKWGSRDRKFFAEQIYEMIRWWRKLWFLLGHEPEFQPDSIVELWATRLKLKQEELPSWTEPDSSPLDLQRLSEIQASRSLQESIPQWLDDLGQNEMGAQWPAILHSLNLPASVDLRANSLVTDALKLSRKLSEQEIASEKISNCEFGLSLIQRKKIQSTEIFKKGLFEIQDRASQQVSPFLQVEPGQLVIDACAGAGGKSLHLAALMKNQGRLISCDVHSSKLQILRERAKRNHVKIIETFLIRNFQDLLKYQDKADRLLLDVPCSGLGVLRRKPMDKWKLNQAKIQNVQLLQSQILNDYCSVVKVGGRMVYSTCSFLPSENELQIKKFLQSHGSTWALEDQIRINPDQHQGDGFYAARLKRLS